jgi:uncharacterized protein (DUF1697 family)
MATYIALLRGINVGGNKKVAMSDLRDLAARLGFEDAKTLLQSGNLVIRGKKQATSAIEKLFRPKLDCEVFVRTADEWKTIVANNPFTKAARDDPGHTLVMCLRDAPAAPAVDALRAAIVGREVVEVRGREAYFVYPDGVGTSKLTHSLIEKKLGVQGTARNWNTTLKLLELTS